MKTTCCLAVIPAHEGIKVVPSEPPEGETIHDHEFYELVYVRSGSGLHHLNGKTYRISAGDMFFLSMVDEHALSPLPSAAEPLQWINCLISPGFMPINASALPSEIRYQAVQGLDAHDLFMDMLDEFRLKPPGYLTALRGCLTMLLAKLERQAAHILASANYEERKKQLLANEAIRYMQLNYMHRIKLQDIASHLGISSSYLSRIFQAYRHTSPIEYLIRYRIGRTCHLLAATDQPVADIAESCGFPDLSSYYSAFKKRNRMTPQQYRQATRHDTALRRGLPQ